MYLYEWPWTAEWSEDGRGDGCADNSRGQPLDKWGWYFSTNIFNNQERRYLAGFFDHSCGDGSTFEYGQ